MKKYTLFLVITAVLMFTGGFFSGMFFSSQITQQEQSKPKIQREESPSDSIEQSSPKDKKEEIDNPNVLIGYVQDFRDPAQVDYSKLTHVIFSFAHPAKDGGLLLNGDMALENLRAMVQKAHEQDTKAMLAVGGWYHIQGGESYKYFKSAIAHPASQTRLINELVAITERENLDGIDIDFEHPRSEGDAQQLAAFTKTLSERLHAKDKELSIAVYSKIHSVAGTEIASVVFEPTMFAEVDHVNIMAYDGQWDGEYNAANLSPYTFTENIVKYWTSLFDTHKISKDKLVLGVPFYAQPEDVSIKQVSYATIINSNPDNAERDRADLNGTTYHYNGVATIQKKTKLALDYGFGGMMLWEMGHDATGVHSLAGAISAVLENQSQQYAVKDNE